MPNVDVVLDTDVLIEILRGNDQAKAWLASIESHIIGIPDPSTYRISNNVDSGNDTRRGSSIPASSVRVTRTPKGAL